MSTADLRSKMEVPARPAKKGFWKLNIGANFVKPATVQFRVWAPYAEQVEVKMVSPAADNIQLVKDEQGYHSETVEGLKAGALYYYKLDAKKERPDPASRYQPEGVHGPSCIVDPADFRWSDHKWKGIASSDLIFYEIHIGTFTAEGTFDAAIEKLPHLKQLGITCVEIMPVAQFPGDRNWGYDGVDLFAVQNSYGGPEGLKRFVNACHKEKLAVCLDVVYNHLGPEGNYLREFAPYFTSKYHTPWGEAVNYDDRDSDGVRHFMVQNALYWIHEYHVDVLRLDAIHAICDFSAKNILEEINDEIETHARQLGRKICVIAESDLNDPKIIRPKQQGGFDLAGQWSDDFHHAIHAFLTHERQGYYEDFGLLGDIVKALQKGFVFDGKRSKFRRRCHGRPLDRPPRQLVVCTQNHDQVGNRPLGERLGTLVETPYEKLSAVVLMCVPNIPLLFMGQEYGETAPFQYFVSHSDSGLLNAVREGRKNEFAFTGVKVPDPAAEETFKSSRLQWILLRQKKHQEILELYTKLIRLRKKYKFSEWPDDAWCNEENLWLSWAYRMKQGHIAICASFADWDQKIPSPFKSKKFKPFFRTEEKKPPSKLSAQEIFMPARSAAIGVLS